jgi:competence protein ComEA
MCGREGEGIVKLRDGLWAGLVVASLVLGAGADARALLPGGQDPKSPAAAPAPINLNSATSAELEKLPGVGPAMAARILEYRQKNGGFKKVEDLMNVQGIGERNFLRLKALVMVAPPKAAER